MEQVEQFWLYEQSWKICVLRNSIPIPFVRNLRKCWQADDSQRCAQKFYFVRQTCTCAKHATQIPQIYLTISPKEGRWKYWTRAAQTFCRHTSIYRYYNDSHTAQDTSTPFLLGQPFILPKDNLVVAAVKATQKYFQRHLPGFGNTLHIKQLSLSSTIMSAQF